MPFSQTIIGLHCWNKTQNTKGSAFIAGHHKAEHQQTKPASITSISSSSVTPQLRDQNLPATPPSAQLSSQLFQPCLPSCCACSSRAANLHSCPCCASPKQTPQVTPLSGSTSAEQHPIQPCFDSSHSLCSATPQLQPASNQPHLNTSSRYSLIFFFSY